MFTIAARQSLSYVKRQAARSQANCAAKLLKQSSRVKKDTSNSANKAVRNAASPDDRENRAAAKLLIMLLNRKILHNRPVTL